MFCANCGVIIEEGSNFCAKCGTAVNTAQGISNQANVEIATVDKKMK
jgi:uncharacterized membrane protein YvbJ